MHFLTHPGPAEEPRQLFQWDEGGRDVTVTIDEGDDLMEGLLAALGEIGVSQAGVQLIGGSLASVSFMTGGPDKSGERVATHQGPWRIEGPLTLLGGTAMIGLDTQGQAMVHGHAYFADSEGEIKGGHLRAGECIAGPGGIEALAACPQRAGFKAALEKETNFPIFHPLDQLPDESAT